MRHEMQVWFLLLLSLLLSYTVLWFKAPIPKSYKITCNTQFNITINKTNWPCFIWKWSKNTRLSHALIVGTQIWKWERSKRNSVVHAAMSNGITCRESQFRGCIHWQFPVAGLRNILYLTSNARAIKHEDIVRKLFKEKTKDFRFQIGFSS